MGRPKGSKNKPKAEAKVKAKAKAKAKPPTKAEAPDWLRKAMAVKAPTKAKVGRKPNALKAKFKAITAKARRGKTMAKQPIYDPMDDPDLRAKDDVLTTPPPKLDQSLPPKPFKGTPLVLEAEPEPAPLYDEVAAGEAIPYDNAEMLIAGTLGGGGDHHSLAKQILGRMVEANWLITKGAEGTPAGMAIKARKEAEAKRRKEYDKDHKGTKEGDDWDHRDAKDKDAKKGKDDDKPAWRA